MIMIRTTPLATTVLVVALLVSSAFASQTRLVQEGDTITFRPSALSLEDNVLTISWSQEGRNRSSRYVQTAAKFDANGEGAFVVLFIQQALIDDLLAGCRDPQESTTCTVEVNSEFQYGQDTEQTSRFLVYHDKSYKPYQHRFISTATASKFMIGVEQLAEKAGSAADGTMPFAQGAAQAFNEVAELGKAVVGDYLRDF